MPPGAGPLPEAPPDPLTRARNRAFLDKVGPWGEHDGGRRSSAQRIEKPDFGYAVQVPRDWQEREPNLRNSPWETARFVDPQDRRHSLIVFRQPTRPGRSAAEIAEGARHSLAHLRFVDFAVSEVTVAGRAGTRLDCVRHDAGRSWHVSEYFVVEDAVTFCLGCGSTVPDEDEALFAAMAERLELLDRN
ncbi:hypothetical protein [Actinoallomurus soli]|uniref:hypothetical protein n=1 Tax=Actinoallomurus soli TaxID=2952535 RepID=UPI00209400FB|nr:hypothetical protein [Actinoallomurus soli]MCO5974780.1 hypothetical protein [Actinoallomurus soli]